MAQHNCTVCGGWYKAQQYCAPGEKSLINMISILLSVSDWLRVMIGTGGLLLVLPNLFAAPVSNFMGGLAKKSVTILGCENNFAGSHTEHCWRCSYPTCTNFLTVVRGHVHHCNFWSTEGGHFKR